MHGDLIRYKILREEANRAMGHAGAIDKPSKPEARMSLAFAALAIGATGLAITAIGNAEAPERQPDQPAPAAVEYSGPQ